MRSTPFRLLFYFSLLALEKHSSQDKQPSNGFYIFDYLHQVYAVGDERLASHAYYYGCGFRYNKMSSYTLISIFSSKNLSGNEKKGIVYIAKLFSTIFLLDLILNF